MPLRQMVPLPILWTGRWKMLNTVRLMVARLQVMPLLLPMSHPLSKLLLGDWDIGMNPGPGIDGACNARSEAATAFGIAETTGAMGGDRNNLTLEGHQLVGVGTARNTARVQLGSA